MQRIDRLLEKRATLLARLSQYPEAISGNLSQSAVPPGSKNFYWRLTWKEKQKTRVQYVRSEDVDTVRQATEQFALLKKMLLQIGNINREIILSRSKRSS
jgi:hypothetical protein